MVQLSCRCLNVHIEVIDNVVKGLSANESADSLPLGSGDPFFASNQALALVTLALGGVSKEHEYLCLKRNVGQWQVNKCTICSLDTHAMRRDSGSVNSNQVLVTLSLETDATNIRSLKLSEDYSPLFRVILPISLSEHTLMYSNNDNMMPATEQEVIRFEGRRGSMSDGTGVQTLNAERDEAAHLLQNVVSQYIKEEQILMEERIRTYTEQQHSHFAALQLKVNREKTALFKAFKEAAANVLDLDPRDRKDEMEDHFNLVMSHCLQEQHEVRNRNDILMPGNGGQFGSFRENRPYGRRSFSQSVERGEMFPIEMEEERPARPFESSDDYYNSLESLNNNWDDGQGDGEGEEEDDPEEGEADPDEGEATSKRSSRQFATSLPVQVPDCAKYMMRSVSHAKDTEEEDQPRGKNDNPEELGESIRAIAKSVYGEASEGMFGDLPRRRLNTGDLVKSRPI